MAAHMGSRAADGFVNKLGTLDTHENLGEPLIMEASQNFWLSAATACRARRFGSSSSAKNLSLSLSFVYV
jgi:hypothetical protein